MPILVGGLDYWTIKQKALNGSRAKLSAEQLTFVGFLPSEPGHHHREHETDTRARAGWTLPPYVERQSTRL